jgi:hypothetical protein
LQLAIVALPASLDQVSGFSNCQPLETIASPASGTLEQLSGFSK